MVANGVVVLATKLLCEEQAASINIMHNMVINLCFISVHRS